MATTERNTYREISNGEGLVLLGRQTRKYLDMSAEDFIAGYDAGDFRKSDDPHVRRLAILIPLGRPDSNREMLARMELHESEDFMRNQLLLQLEAFVFSHQLRTEEQQFPFYKEAEYIPRGLLAVPALLTILLTAVGLLASSLILTLAAMAIAGGGIVTFVLNPPTKVVASGRVHIASRAYNVFPEANIVYPPELGTAYRHVIRESRLEYDRH